MKKKVHLASQARTAVTPRRVSAGAYVYPSPRRSIQMNHSRLPEMSMPNPGKCARALGPAKRIAGVCGSKSWGPSRVPGQLAKLQVSSLAECESQVCLGRTLKASPKFTTQIYHSAFRSRVVLFLRNLQKVLCSHIPVGIERFPLA